jgi:hypothetical protein
VLRAFVVWVVLAASASVAGAAPGFVWAAPAPPCPDAGEMRARIERRLGMPVDGSVHGIEVEIAREDGQFVAHIDLRGVTLANQPRTLTSARCDELADAVAIVVARLASEVQAKARSEAAHAGVTSRLPAPPTARRGAGPWGVGVRAGAVSGIGLLPGVGVAGEIALYARRHRYFAELAGALWSKNPKYLVDGAPGGVNVSLVTAAVRAGWSPPDMYIRAWVVGEAGPMTGEGIALVDPRIGTGRWAAAGGGFGVTWPMSDRARLVGSVEALGAFEQVRFVLVDGGEIYRPSQFVARCALGLEIGWR